jgi:hypothetical protein
VDDMTVMVTIWIIATELMSNFRFSRWHAKAGESFYFSGESLESMELKNELVPLGRMVGMRLSIS